MNKKKSAILILLVVTLFTLATCLLVACNDDPVQSTETETIEATEGLLINNSDFKVVDTSVSTYPRTSTGWTGAKMYSSSLFRDDVVSGVISLVKDEYNANKSAWSDDDDKIFKLLNAGGRYDGDADAIKHALMVHMPLLSQNEDGNNVHGPTAYGYTSSSFTLNKGSYYKLSVDVLTYDIQGDGKTGSTPGARIYVSSNTYAEFDAINTDGKWVTYEIYIETSPSSSTSLTVQLGLGKYTSSFTTGLTTGYAFFDNVVLTCLDDEETENVIEGADKFEAAATTELEKNGFDEDRGVFVQTTSLKVPNGKFNFGSLSPSSSGTPNGWSLVTGNSGKDDPAPSNSANWNAIIDTARDKFNENFSNYSTTLTLRSNEGTPSRSYKPADNLVDIVDSIERKGTVGTKVYMFSQQYMTAQGIRSSRTITIEKGKTYKLSLWLYTFDVHGDGVSLILSGSDSEDIVIKGISRQLSDDIFIGSQKIMATTGYEDGSTRTPGATTGGWKEYDFYIKGNQYSDYNYNLSIWLGTEGTNSNNSVKYHNFTSGATAATTYRANGTFANGWVFVDDLALEAIDDAAFAEKYDALTEKSFEVDVDESSADTNYIAVDLSTPDDENGLYGVLEGSNGKSLDIDSLTAVGAGAPTGWKSNVDLDDAKIAPLTDGNIYEGVVDIEDENKFHSSVQNEVITYPGFPYDMPEKKAYMIYADSTGYYEVESKPITIAANSFNRITFWLKTVDVKSSSGAYVYLLDKTEQGEKDQEVNLTSFTKINTADYDTYLKDWVEINIVIRGAEKEKEVALKFTLGTGNRFEASTRTSGQMYVANFRMASITYANFNGTTTSTYTKSVDMHKAATSSSSFSNSSFNSYDPDDENLDPGKPLYEQANAATPEDWTINDNTLPINGEEDAIGFAGVIALNENEDGSFGTSTQAETVTGLSSDVFNNFYDKDFSDVENMKAIAGPNVLALGAKSGEKLAMGYASDSFTLNANSYYSLTVYARTQGVDKARIFLTGESSSVGSNAMDVEGVTEGVWTKFTFYIRVGKTSVSLKLNLWLGDDYQYTRNDGQDEEEFKNSFKSGGVVFFDNVVFKTIEEDDYNNATVSASSKKISFMTDSFDALSSTVESRGSLTSPSGWSGAAGSNQSSSNTKSGVIYADSSYYENKAVRYEDADGNQVDETYVGILGRDYDSESVEITDQELAEARATGKYTDKNDADLLDILENNKRTELKTKNWIPISELYTRPDNGTDEVYTNNQMLVINNTSASAYTYTSSSNTFTESSFYEVSVWVRTYGIGAGEPEDEVEDMDEYIKSKQAGAYVELYLGSANETDNPLIFKAIIADEWTKLTFYVQTQDVDVTSVTLRLSLGKYYSDEVDGETVISGLTNGYAMFDDVYINKLEDFTDEEFKEIFNKTNPEESTYDEEFAKTTLARTVMAEVSGSTSTETEEPTVPSGNTFNLEYLWWMIPTIVLGVIIIVVVVVFIIRKVRKPKKQVTKVRSSSKTTAPVVTQTLDEKRDRYDEDKE